jgi:hypothetical protein
MTRKAFIMMSAVWAGALTQPACGPRIDVCAEGCDESTTSSVGTTSSATTVLPTTSTGEVTLTGEAATSASSTSTGSDTSTSTSFDESTGIPGPSVTPGDPSPCLIGGNILVLDGDEGKYVHPGSQILDDADWAFTASGDPIDDLQINVTTDGGMGEYWMVWFSTHNVPAPLAVGEYLDAMRPPFEDPGHPGVDTFGNGMGCNRVSGYFEIHELEIVANTVTLITATWERHCEEGRLALRGCLHWAQ